MYHKYKAYRRFQNRNHQARREHIAENVFNGNKPEKPGVYRKGKVHCSCPLCAVKSNRKKGKKCTSFDSLTISDKRKHLSMNNSLHDYEQNC